MAEENGLDGNISSNQAASTSKSTTILDKNMEKAHNQKDSEKSKGEEDDSKNTVPFYKLFAFADSTDVFLMIVGTVAAVANGVAMPLMALLMGEVVNAFGGTTNNHDIVEKVSKVYTWFKLNSNSIMCSGC